MTVEEAAAAVCAAFAGSRHEDPRRVESLLMLEDALKGTDIGTRLAQARIRSELDAASARLWTASRAAVEVLGGHRAGPANLIHELHAALEAYEYLSTRNAEKP